MVTDTERKTINILGVPVDYTDPDNALKKITEFLNENHNHSIYTPNAEFMMEAWRNPAFREILSRADMCVADGAGVVLASKILKTPLPAKVPGIDLSESIMSTDLGRKLKVFLFGAKPGVADEAARLLKIKYPNIEIAGTRNGYFEETDEEEIVNMIASASPDLLLVALGRLKQESFIDRYKDRLNTRISIGVGGSLDIFSGNTRLAPPFFRKNGLEWLYRLCIEPKRFFRMLDLPRFVLVITGVRLGLIKSVRPSDNNN